MRHSCIVCQRSSRQNNQVQSIFSNLFTSEVRNLNPFLLDLSLSCLALSEIDPIPSVDLNDVTLAVEDDNYVHACCDNADIIVVDVAVVIITVR